MKILYLAVILKNIELKKGIYDGAGVVTVNINTWAIHPPKVGCYTLQKRKSFFL